MVQAALRFILSYKEVSVIIPGAKNIPQLNHNLSASEGVLPMQMVNELKDFWEEEIKDSRLTW